MANVRAFLWLLGIVFFGVVHLPVALMGVAGYLIALIGKLCGANKEFVAEFCDYGLHHFMAYDQNINTSLKGRYEETISSRVGYLWLTGSKTAAVIGYVIDPIFWLTKRQKHHCFASIERRFYPKDDITKMLLAIGIEIG